MLEQLLRCKGHSSCLTIFSPLCICTSLWLSRIKLEYLLDILWNLVISPFGRTRRSFYILILSNKFTLKWSFLFLLILFWWISILQEFTLWSRTSVLISIYERLRSVIIILKLLLPLYHFILQQSILERNTSIASINVFKIYYYW